MMDSHEPLFQFQEGEVLLFDKPYGWTSFDVVGHVRNSIRTFLGLDSIKVGHAGTLDPLATGLLILCTGKATRLIDSIQGMEKTYTGTLRLGATTPSYDLETVIDKEYDWEHINTGMLQEAARSLTGVLEQIPPAFSAVHIDGKRAYKIARKKHRDMELPSRTVEVIRFNLSRIALPDVDFEVQVSKGTYIRSLVDDFGRHCKSGAHLIALRRTASGNYHVADAMDPLAFREMLKSLKNL